MDAYPAGHQHATLPPLYARWLDDVLDGPIPAETEATCDDCAMCAHGEAVSETSGYHFDSSIKCCSFVPELPNFVVGRILADDDPNMAEGRRTLETRLATGVGVTPLGLGRSPTYQLLYAHLASVRGFGRSRTIRCPHYLEASGQCSIWRHRESTCATWFCKHVRGEVGRRFWLSVQHLLSAMERELSRWCVVELDLGADAMRRLFAAWMEAEHTDPIEAGELDGIPDAKVHQANWGNWAGRELEFYRAAAQLVEGLSWDDVVRVGGTQLRVLARVLHEAHGELVSDALPARLRVSGVELLRSSPDYSRVVTYNACDPIDVPKAVLDVLHHFDGRPTDQALQNIALETGVNIDRSQLRTLVDFGVLVSCSSARRGEP